jgi:hypothetical protein
MTNTEKEFMEKQFNKAVKACETVAKKNACVKELTVLKKDKFWKTWAQVNGYSHLVKKTHRFVAVLRLNFGNGGDLCYSVSNPEQPEIAVLDVIKMAIVGWTPTPDGQTISTFSKYGSVAQKNFKKAKSLMDAFVKAMEAPEKKKVRKAYNIKWDTDGATLKECGLPRSVTIPDDVADDEVGDWLSDEYGFCHDGYMTNFEE